MANTIRTAASGRINIAPAKQLFDYFVSKVSAPLAGTRTCNPGPGTLTITDASNIMSVKGQSIEFKGVATANSGVETAAIARATGLAFGVRLYNFIYAHANSLRIGMDSGGVTGSPSSMGYGFLLNQFGSTIAANVSLGGYTVCAFNTASRAGADLLIDVLVILRSSGAYILIRSNPANSFTLAWVTNYNSANYVGKVSVDGNATDPNYFRITNFKAAQLTDTRFLGSDYALATNYIVNPAANRLTSSTPDFLLEYNFTMQAAAVVEVMFARIDDNNTWILRMDQAAGTIKLFQKAAGVETEVNAGKTTTFTAGNTYTVRIIRDTVLGKLWAGINENMIHNSLSESFQTTATGIKVNTAGTSLILYPRFVNEPQGMFESSQIKYFWPLGDSKTAGSVDTNPPLEGQQGYPYMLTSSMSKSANVSWIEMPRFALGGYKVADLKAGIDAKLAAATQTPDYVLINIGINDVNATTQASFQNDYGYVLDAIHTKFPNANCYLMRVWGKSYAMSVFSPMDDVWIPNVISTRSSFAFLGPEERIFLENGDNGATYMGDTVHPNHAGHLLSAAKWQAVLGY